MTHTIRISVTIDTSNAISSTERINGAKRASRLVERSRVYARSSIFLLINFAVVQHQRARELLLIHPRSGMLPPLRIVLSPTHTRRIETCKFPRSASVITSEVIIVIDTDCLRAGCTPRARSLLFIKTSTATSGITESGRELVAARGRWRLRHGSPRLADRPLAASAELIEEERAVCLLSAATS